MASPMARTGTLCMAVCRWVTPTHRQLQHQVDELPAGLQASGFAIGVGRHQQACSRLPGSLTCWGSAVAAVAAEWLVGLELCGVQLLWDHAGAVRAEVAA